LVLSIKFLAQILEKDVVLLLMRAITLGLIYQISCKQANSICPNNTQFLFPLFSLSQNIVFRI